MSLSISVGGDVAVSTRSTLRANVHSGGGQVLGHHHHCLPPLSLTTPPPCQLGLTVVVALPHPPWLSSFCPLSTSRAVACEIGGRWCVVHYRHGALELVVLVAGWGWQSCTPIAPPIHCTSSGSWQWLGVLSSSVPFHPQSTP